MSIGVGFSFLAAMSLTGFEDALPPSLMLLFQSLGLTRCFVILSPIIGGLLSSTFFVLNSIVQETELSPTNSFATGTVTTVYRSTLALASFLLPLLGIQLLSIDEEEGVSRLKFLPLPLHLLLVVLRLCLSMISHFFISPSL